MNKMKKLVLLVAIATTISFAACTNTKTTERTEETTIEKTVVPAEAPLDADTVIVVEEITTENVN